MDSSKFLRIHRSSSAAPIPSCGTCSNICVLNSLMTCFTVNDILLIHIYITLRNCMYVLIFNYNIQLYIYIRIIWYMLIIIDMIALYYIIILCIYIYYIACTYFFLVVQCTPRKNKRTLCGNMSKLSSPRNGPWVRPWISSQQRRHDQQMV